MTVVVLLLCGAVFAAVPLVLELRRSGERSTLATAGREVRQLARTGAQALVVVTAGGAVAVGAIWVVLLAIARLAALIGSLFS